MMPSLRWSLTLQDESNNDPEHYHPLHCLTVKKVWLQSHHQTINLSSLSLFYIDPNKFLMSAVRGSHQVMTILSSRLSRLHLTLATRSAPAFRL